MISRKAVLLVILAVVLCTALTGSAKADPIKHGEVWTTDTLDNPKDTFLVGETVRIHWKDFKRVVVLVVLFERRVVAVRLGISRTGYKDYLPDRGAGEYCIVVAGRVLTFGVTSLYVIPEYLIEGEGCTISRHCYTRYYCPAKHPHPGYYHMEAITGYENPADPYEWVLVKIDSSRLGGEPYILVFTIASAGWYPGYNNRILIRRVEAFDPQTVTYYTRPKRLTPTTGWPPTTPWMCRLRDGPWGGVILGEYQVDITGLVEEARAAEDFDGFLYIEMEYLFDWMGSSGNSCRLVLDGPPAILYTPPVSP